MNPTARALALLLFLAACGDGGGGLPPAPDAAVGRVDAGPPDAAPADARPLTGDILVDLRATPGVESVEEQTGPTGYRLFQVGFRQPVDHAAPGGATFIQRVRVLHRDPAAPVVLYTSGYDFYFDARTRFEPTSLVAGNQIAVEHRFFGGSIPSPADWTKLDIRQAAADHHAIVQAFRSIYAGRWLSTGHSKDGMAAVYHRRFYPGDVDGTIAYVAPQSLDGPDARYIDFVAQVGDASCRQKLLDLQRLILSRRAQLEPMMSGRPTSFEILGPDVAFEHATIELPFGFWQYGSALDCASIPGSTASNTTLFNYLVDVGDLDAYGDGDLTKFAGYYYQAATELGWPGYSEASLSDLLQHPGSDKPSSYIPQTTTYDRAPMADVDHWVQTEGRSLMFIYGGSDPWTAGAFRVGNAADSFFYTVAGGNHQSRITSLPAMVRDAAQATVRRWAGVGTAAKPAAVEDVGYVLPRTPL